jgi:drug/metabolite transporter (DMT)-like permease
MTNKTNNSKTKAFYIKYLLFLLPIIWGSSPTIMKYGLKDMSPNEYNFYRMVICTITFFLLMVVKKEYRKIRKEDLLDFFTLVCISYLCYQLFLPMGIKNTSSGLSALILSLIPVTLYLSNLLTKKEKSSASTLKGITVTIVGTLIILSSEMTSGSSSVIGIIYMIIALLGQTFYTLRCRKYSAYLSSNQILFYTSTFASIFFFITSYKDILARNFSVVSSITWGSILFNGLFAIGLANILWILGIKTMGSVKTAVYVNLTPVVAFITAFILLKEAITISQILGTIIIMIGIFMTQAKKAVVSQKEKKDALT